MDIDAGPDTDAFEEEREAVERPMWRLFREYGGEQKGAFVVGLASSILARILDLLPPLLLAVAIDSIFRGERAFSLFLVPEAWLPTTEAGQLWLTGGIIAVSFLGAAVFHYTRNWGWNRFAQGVQHDVRTDTYDKMQRLNMDFFADKQTGELMSVLSNDVNRLEKFLNDGINSASRLVVMVLGIAVILFAMNWQLALVALLPVPLIAVFTRKFIEIIQPKYAEVRSTVGSLNSRLENNLGGIKVIKSSNTEPYESDRVEDVSFEVEGGDTVALVGPTGAGKSTAMKLLLRLYDVDEGAIRIDGTDVREVSVPSLRREMGYVGQETYLFYGTVRDNIAYGVPDASDEEIRAAAEAAEAHEFVRNLPDGYDTMVGERGVKLSGGQRQRVAIARAILRDPEILLLDEATSDVDTETELLIQRSLDDLTADRTTLVIAHRLSTVKDADHIVVIEDGLVVERGTHDELLEADGLYANLWAVQAGEIDELPEEFIERAARRRAATDADD